jgi:hypothetical protein
MSLMGQMLVMFFKNIFTKDLEKHLALLTEITAFGTKRIIHIMMVLRKPPIFNL